MNPPSRKWSNRVSCQERRIQVGIESKLLNPKTLKYVGVKIRTTCITVVKQHKLGLAFVVDI